MLYAERHLWNKCNALIPDAAVQGRPASCHAVALLCGEAQLGQKNDSEMLTCLLVIRSVSEAGGFVLLPADGADGVRFGL